MFTPGSRVCAYKTASGRGEWPNRDPIGEPGFETVRKEMTMLLAGGPNRYLFSNNDPNDGLDDMGLSFLDDLGNIVDAWKQLPQKMGDETCFGILLQVKTDISDYKTERINGCKFACCPLPASAIAAIGEIVLNKMLNKPFFKQCGAGKTCCGIESSTGELGKGGIPFTIETGPHVGENGSVTIAGYDVTDALKQYADYKPTTATTTCRFSGSVHLDGTITVSVGDCK
jgi:hypothetical protein